MSKPVKADGLFGRLEFYLCIGMGYAYAGYSVYAGEVVLGPHSGYTRDESPLWFWLCVLGLIGLSSFGLWQAWRGRRS
ncbi:MAG: hypothetical protein ACPHCJ_11995 [Oceanococcaceae bacterium]